MELKEAFKTRIAVALGQQTADGFDAAWRGDRVASVIAVVTLVNGANTYVTTKFTRYGADVFTVSQMPADHHQLRGL